MYSERKPAYFPISRDMLLNLSFWHLGARDFQSLACSNTAQLSQLKTAWGWQVGEKGGYWESPPPLIFNMCL